MASKRYQPFFSQIQPLPTMPARPVADETLQLIAAVRDALAEHLGGDASIEERTLFGCHAFMVHEKLCLAVKGEDLLERLSPAEHEPTAETPGLRELLGESLGPTAVAVRREHAAEVRAALAELGIVADGELPAPAAR